MTCRNEHTLVVISKLHLDDPNEWSSLSWFEINASKQKTSFITQTKQTWLGRVECLAITYPTKLRNIPKGDYPVKSGCRVCVGHLVNPYAKTCAEYSSTQPNLCKKGVYCPSSYIYCDQRTKKIMAFASSLPQQSLLAKWVIIWLVQVLVLLSMFCMISWSIWHKRNVKLWDDK